MQATVQVIVKMGIMGLEYKLKYAKDETDARKDS